MTNEQIIIIHIAAKQVGLIDSFGNAAGYKMLLDNVGGVATSKDLTNETFEDVMAVMEDMGFDGRREFRGTEVNDQFIRRVEAIAGKNKLCLPDLCGQASQGRLLTVNGMRPCEATRLMNLLDGLPIFFPTYWRDKVQQRGQFANARMVWKIQQLAAKCDRYPVEGMCKRMSKERTADPNQLTPVEGWRLIEAYKAIVDRNIPADDAAGFQETRQPAIAQAVAKSPAKAIVQIEIPDDDVPF